MFVVHLAGRLGKKPESRYTPSGQKVTSFTMAINQRRGKGKEDVTTWVRVTIWGDRFDNMLAVLDKGSALIVTGKMNPPSSYIDKEGKTQFSLEVTAEMLEFSPFGRTDGDKVGGYTPQSLQAHAVEDEQPAFEGGFSGGNRGGYSGAFSSKSNALDNDDDVIPF